MTERTGEQTRNRATPHRHDPGMEHLLQLRSSDPGAFAALNLSPTQHIGLALYQNAKASAAAGTAHTLDGPGEHP